MTHTSSQVVAQTRQIRICTMIIWRLMNPLPHSPIDTQILSDYEHQLVQFPTDVAWFISVLRAGYDGGDCCSCTCEDPTTGGGGACDTTYDCQNIHADCYVPDTTYSSSSSSSSSNNILYIALGAAGGVIIAIVAIGLLCFFVHKKPSSNPSELPGPQQHQPSAPSAPPAYPIVEAKAYRAPPPYGA